MYLARGEHDPTSKTCLLQNSCYTRTLFQKIKFVLLALETNFLNGKCQRVSLGHSLSTLNSIFFL